MYRKATLFALVLAFFAIALSAYVRLSDVGLGVGCPDWPTCYGQAFVTDDAEFKTQAEILFPEYPFNFNKAWKEMAQRYVAALLALSILFLAVGAWLQKPFRVAAIGSTLLLLFLISFQAFFAYWTVHLMRMPIIVTGYVFLGFLIFWQLYWLYLRTHSSLEYVSGAEKRGPRLLTWLAMVMLGVQVILGIWTSTNQAGLACSQFPRCNETWMPAVDYLSALNLFAGLESGYRGVLSFDGQIAVHWLHRIGAFITFVLLSLLMLSATSQHCAKPVRRAGLVLSFALLIQIVLGIASVKLELSLHVVLAHSIFAAILMLPLVAISFYSKYTYKDEREAADLVEPELEIEVDGAAVESPVADTSVVAEAYVEPTAESLYLRLKTQLKKTRTGLGGVLSSIPIGQKEIDEDLLEQIESSLLMADIGIDATNEIISRLTDSLERHQLKDSSALENALKEILLEILQPSSQPLEIPKQDHPFVILVVGINGVGKTTTIGKMAKRFQNQGHSVMLAAGDTFRAAAVEQLQTWGERNNIHVVAQHTGADSASVIYDGVQSAQAKGIDVLIADTAGRLHTKSNLMEELSKIKRIIKKIDPTAPHELLLVLDAGTGQNALSQTKIFNEAVELTGLAITKLDGTAKGGVVFALARQHKLPIRFIGVGEGIDDLQDFNAQAFIDALFVKD